MTSQNLRFGVHLQTSASFPFAKIKGLAESAERLGYDSLWASDHIVREAGGRGSGLLEPLMALASLASLTERIKIGTAVLLLPLRHPLLVASMIASLDQISGGRVILGLGMGWRREEFDAMNVEFTHRGRIVDESIEVLKAAWASDRVDYDGEKFKIKGVALEVQPVQRPHPPIWIGGNGGRAISRAVRLGDAWFPTDPSVEEFKKASTLIGSLCKRFGRRSDSLLIANHIYVCISKNSKSASEKAEFLIKMTGDQLDQVKTWAIVGDPEEVRRRINEYVKAGVRYFVFSFPPEEAEADYELLMQEVLMNMRE